MALFDRWRHYAGNPEYDALFAPEVRELAAAAFGCSGPAELDGRSIVRGARADGRRRAQGC